MSIEFKPEPPKNIGMGNSNIRGMSHFFAQCKPGQYIREYCQNGIESYFGIPENSDHFMIDSGKPVKKIIRFAQVQIDGVNKLAIFDNGKSMTIEQAEAAFSALFHGNGMLHEDNQNFGLGARIASLPNNSLGIRYLFFPTLENFSAAKMFLDKKSGNYQYVKEDQNVLLAKLKAEEKSCFKKGFANIQKAGHGTVVILMGNSPEEDTTLPPENFVWNVDKEDFEKKLKKRSKRASGSLEEDFDDEGNPNLTGKRAWVGNYLNNRYYSFPDGIEVWVTYYGKDGKGEEKNHEIKGFQHILKDAGRKGKNQDKPYYDFKEIKKYGEGKNTATITTAILEENLAELSHGCLYNLVGQFLLVSEKGEIYYHNIGKKGGWSGIQSRKWGINISTQAHRVVIAVQCSGKATMTRNGLIDDSGNPIDINFWAEEYRYNMPKILKDFLNIGREQRRQHNNLIGDERTLAKFYEYLNNNLSGDKTDILKCFRSGGKETINLLGQKKNPPSFKGDMVNPAKIKIGTKTPQEFKPIQEKSGNKKKFKFVKGFSLPSFVSIIKPSEAQEKSLEKNEDEVRVMEFTFNSDHPNGIFSFNMYHPFVIDRMEVIRKELDDKYRSENLLEDKELVDKLQKDLYDSFEKAYKDRALQAYFFGVVNMLVKVYNSEENKTISPTRFQNLVSEVLNKDVLKGLFEYTFLELESSARQKVSLKAN